MNFKDVLKQCNSFAILTHERPDGDAIASSLAIYWYIKSTLSDVDVDVIIPEYSRKFSFLPGFENIKTEPSREKYDMLIVVDVSEPHRIKGYDMLLNCYSKTICFDHHEGFVLGNCNVAVINPSAPSTTAILFELFGNNVCPEFLECVLTGILSDTQNLTFNTNDETISIVEALGCLGVDVNKFKNLIAKEDQRTVVLTNLTFKRMLAQEFSGHKVIFSYITQEDLLKEEQSLAIVDHKQIIKDILEKTKTDVLVFAVENNQNEWKFSMRSMISELDLNELCKKLVEIDNSHFLKGGGHSYSAGLTAIGKYEDIIHCIGSQLAKKLA